MELHIACLYHLSDVSRKGSGRGLASIEDYVTASIKGLEDDIKTSKLD